MTALRLPILLALLCLAAPAAAQEVEPVLPPADTLHDDRPSATGALLRSLVLPGWGQASYERYIRGGVFFSGHVGNTFMLFKTLTKLDEAEDLLARREAATLAELRDQGVTDADSLRTQLAANPQVRRLRSLVDARKEQREDWIAVGLFWILISGVDAFVQAQLADFPAEIAARHEEGRVLLQITVPVR